MRETLVIINCSQLVTLAGPRRPRTGDEMRELSIIEDGAMIVRGDVIERVGTRAEVEPHAGANCEVFDAGGRIVLPGFVDAHAHPVFAGNRADEFEKRAAGASYQEIAASGGGIRSTVRRTRAASEDDLFASAKRREEWFLRTGTTTVEAKSGYGLSIEDELKMLRVVRRLNGEGSSPMFRRSSARTKCRTKCAHGAESTLTSSLTRCCRASHRKILRSSAMCSARSASSRSKSRGAS